MNPTADPIVIVSAARTPMGSLQGDFAALAAHDLGGVAIAAAVARSGIAPELVYAHDWKKGDLVFFNNHGVLHSVVGAFQPDEVRLFRQCNMAASQPPKGPNIAIAAA